MGGGGILFYVIGNEVDIFFDLENREGKEFIETGRWKTNFYGSENGSRGQLFRCKENKEKSFLLFAIWLFSSL